MSELYVFCEGQTEQQFCARVLGPHLFSIAPCQLHTIRIAHNRHHGVVSRGGITRYAPVRRDILNTLKSRKDHNVFFTTMFDVYGLAADFPGKTGQQRNPNDPYPYVQALEAAFRDDIADPRLIPYLQLHEFEAMLFVDPEAFRIAFDDCGDAIAHLGTIAKAFPSVEHINDGSATAPSKRIIAVLPEYDGLKPTAGPDIATMIGLVELRRGCPHLNGWLNELEKKIVNANA